MTREEAITQLDLLLEYCESMMTSEYPVWRRDCEALQMLIAALRPVSREQVEKVWRAHWNESVHLGGFVYCSRCGYNALEANNYTFCPKCGSPFTDEAVQMVMRRLEGMDNGTVPCDNA